MLIQVEIEGVTPLLMNRFTDAAGQDTTGRPRSSFTGEKGTPREQAELLIYRDSQGNIGVPQPNVLRCLIDAGIYFKVGKRQLTTQKSSLIPGVVDIHGVMLPLTYTDPWEVDTRPVRIPSTGGRILKNRPMFEKWGLTFTVDLDEQEVPESTFRALVDAAGRKIGLGDFRPSTKGPFGKFVVVSWVRV